MKAPVAHDGYGRVAWRLLGWGAVFAVMCLLPQLMFMHGDQKPDRAQLDVANIRNALTVYRNKTGAWPLEANWSGALVQKGILEGAPLDPWGHLYLYRLEAPDGGELQPRITSCGPDGEEGTDDDVPSRSSLRR